MNNHPIPATSSSAQQRRSKRKASISPSTVALEEKKKAAEQEQRASYAKRASKTAVSGPAARRRRTLQAEESMLSRSPSSSQRQNRGVPGDSSIEELSPEVQSVSGEAERPVDRVPPGSKSASGHLLPLVGEGFSKPASSRKEETLCLASSFAFSDADSVESQSWLQRIMNGSAEKESERSSHPLGGDLSGALPTHSQGKESNNEGLLASRITRIEEMMEKINRTVCQVLAGVGNDSSSRLAVSKEGSLARPRSVEEVDVMEDAARESGNYGRDSGPKGNPSEGKTAIQSVETSFQSPQSRIVHRQPSSVTADLRIREATPLSKQHRPPKRSQIPPSMETYDPTLTKPLPQYSQDAYHAYLRSIRRPMPAFERSETSEDDLDEPFSKGMAGSPRRQARNNSVSGESIRLQESPRGSLALPAVHASAKATKARWTTPEHIEPMSEATEDYDWWFALMHEHFRQCFVVSPVEQRSYKRLQFNLLPHHHQESKRSWVSN